MADNIRRQLTLFVDQSQAIAIEKVRRQFNPQQAKLIKAHVTLCREDEIEDLDKVLKALSQLTSLTITIEFTEVKRIENGKGVLLTPIHIPAKFENLRRQILSGITNDPRELQPHITLMHPRNSTCTDDIFNQIKKMNLPVKLTFNKSALLNKSIAASGKRSGSLN